MKLVKQVTLRYKKGSSDKVYEVDLCEVGDDEYVVNFRYGRFGANLRDGSKTVGAVPRAEADKVFDALIASKVKKGYRAAGGLDAESTDDAVPNVPVPSRTPGEYGARERAIVERIEGSSKDDWRLSRAIWRAGQLAIRQAEPGLLGLVGRDSKNDIQVYSLAWALGRCGTKACVPVLERIWQDEKRSEHVRHIAAIALTSVDGGSAKQKVVDHLEPLLPKKLHGLQGDLLADAFAALRVESPDQAAKALYRSYVIDDERFDALRGELLMLPFTHKDVFPWFRRIFKAAEYRRDPRVFGLIAHRFETTRHNTHTEWYEMFGGWNWNHRQAPYTAQTRRYLRRRIWQTLRRLGSDGDPDFVRMAVGVLLPFTDADAKPPMTRTYYSWNGPDRELSWGEWAPFWAFNHLLFGKSSRYRADSTGRAFRKTDTFQEALPARREESFPELWDRTPAALLHLLDESHCRPVHELAVKAVRTQQAFLDELDLDVIVMLLGRPYEITAELGFDLARKRYDPRKPDHALVRGVAECAYAPARAQARTWIETDRLQFVADSALMAGLACSEHADNRSFALDFLRSTSVADDVARLIIGRLFAALTEIGAEQAERAADAADIAFKCFGRQLRGIGADAIRDLAGHPVKEVQELVGNILLHHDTLARAAPDDLILALIGSDYDSVRGMGARLLSNLADDALLARAELLVGLVTHEHAALRASIRPAIVRLASSQPQFAADLAALFVARLMTSNPEGVPADLLSLLRTELRGHLGEVSKDTVMRLLSAKSPYAQELGGLLLATNVDPDALSINDIVKLTNHEILSIRQGAWGFCENNVDRLRLAMNGAIRLLDARWPDSREWAFAFFRTAFTRADLTPEVLVGICDSIRPDVQRFGQQLITEYFEADRGQEYLTRLSEHPSSSVQLFATNYLERYATGNAERLLELEPYFIRVLSAVNRARVAKKRIIAFLSAEAVQSLAAAEVAARIFGRQSVTMAIEYKAALIEGLVAIKQAYPDVALPIRIVPVEVRGGV